jgi:uncharacterized protein (TIGR02466 family)
MFESLFPVTIYRDKITGLDEAFELIKEDAEAIWAKPTALHPDIGPITFTTYNDNNTLQHHPAFKNIIPQLEVMIEKCWKEYKLYKGLTPHIHEMWVNKTLKNSAVNIHNHSPYLLSGVMYFNMKPGMGNLVFENPNHLVTSLQPFNWERPDEIQWNIEQVMHVEPGDIIMFPGWLRHKTEINTTDEPRYISSFNVGVTGDYPVSSYLQQKRL